jgi:hypothetical protein
MQRTINRAAREIPRSRSPKRDSPPHREAQFPCLKTNPPRWVVKRAKRKLPGSPHGTLIRVGGATEVEVKEKKDRVDDATHATRAAVEEGIVPGGGVALLYAAKALDGLTAENSDQVGIVKRALQSPVRRVAENAGDDGSVVVGKLLDSNDRAVTPTDSLRHVFFSTRSESKESEPSNPFQNERKIVARRRRRTSLCNKASLYQEYTWLVKFLVFEPRTQVLTSMPRLPHVQQRIGAVESPKDDMLYGELILAGFLFAICSDTFPDEF